MKTKEYLPKKILLTLNSPNFGGRSSLNVQDFGSNPKGLELLKNIPCHVSANIKFEAAQFIWSS